MLHVVGRLCRESTGADADEITSDTRDVPDQLRSRLNLRPVGRTSIGALAKDLLDEGVARGRGEERGTVPPQAEHRVESRARTPFGLRKGAELGDALVRRRLRFLEGQRATVAEGPQRLEIGQRIELEQATLRFSDVSR